MADFDRVLVIETAGRVGQAALMTGDAVMAAKRLDEGHRRASDLAPVVSDLLTSANWKVRDLTAVVVGLGPGSYTGLRVGLASAKALAYATGCQFFGVETFAAIAMNAPHGDVSVVADALQGNLFHRDYRRLDERQLEPLCDLQVIVADDWLRSLTPKMRVSGPAAPMFAAKLSVAPESDRQPRPEDLVAVARTCPWAVTTDMWRAEPHYLRGSSAEEKAPGRAP